MSVRHHQHGRQTEHMPHAPAFRGGAIAQDTADRGDRPHLGVQSCFLLCVRLPMQPRPVLLATCARGHRWTVHKSARRRHWGVRVLGCMRGLRLDDGCVALVHRSQDADGLANQDDGGIRASHGIYVSPAFPLSVLR